MRRPLTMLTALALAACGAGEEQVDDRQALLDTITYDLLVPGHEAFAEDAALMARALEAHCASPTDASLETAREAWSQARGSWKKLEVFAFGPYREFPERLGPLLDFWPVREETVLEILAEDVDVSADALDGYGAAQRGFPVLEYLMFGPEDELAGAASAARRCDYMVGVAVDIERTGAELVEAWAREGGYAERLVEPSTPESMYMDVQEALSEPINRMWFTLENIRRDKLGRPVGDSTGGTPQPTKVESYYGRRSRQDLLDALSTLDAMFEIDGGIAEHPRLAERPEVVEAFRANMAAARAALEALGDPLSEQVVTDQESVRAAITTLASLQRTIQVDLINVLSLLISFNDADGD